MQAFVEVPGKPKGHGFYITTLAWPTKESLYELPRPRVIYSNVIPCSLKSWSQRPSLEACGRPVWLRARTLHSRPLQKRRVQNSMSWDSLPRTQQGQQEAGCMRCLGLGNRGALRQLLGRGRHADFDLNMVVCSAARSIHNHGLSPTSANYECGTCHAGRLPLTVISPNNWDCFRGSPPGKAKSCLGRVFDVGCEEQCVCVCACARTSHVYINAHM